MEYINTTSSIVTALKLAVFLSSKHSLYYVVDNMIIPK